MDRFKGPPGLRDSNRRTVSNKVFQDEATFTKYSRESGGACTELEILLKPSGGNPLHLHKKFTETFTPLSGKLGIQVKNDVLHLDSESESPLKASAPPSTPHRFFNPSSTDAIRFHVSLTPGNEGFEKSIYVVYGLANDGLCDDEGLPKNFLHLCVLAGLGDIHLAGSWTEKYVLNFAVRIGYWVARWTGVEKQLVEKYWT